MKNINWKTVKEYDDITYKKADGVARIAFNRPNVRNAFRPHTTSELLDAFKDAHEDVNIGVVLLSAEGPLAVVLPVLLRQSCSGFHAHSPAAGFGPSM